MLSLKNMKFKTKLMLLVLAALAGLLVFGIASYSTLNKVKVGGPIANEIRMAQDVTSGLVPPTLNIISVRLAIRTMLLETEPAKVQRDIAQYQKAKQAFEDSTAKWAKLLPEGQLKELATVTAHDSGEQYIQKMDQDVIPAVLRGDKQAAVANFFAAMAVAEANAASTNQAAELAQHWVDDSTKRAEETVSSSLMFLAGLGVVIGIVVGGLGIVIARGILGPLGRTIEVLQLLASGDLRQTLDLDSTDEVGTMATALNQAIGGMAETIQSIAGTAEHVASASEEISSSASQQAQGAETQKDQTAQVATAMQEMSSTVLQVSENSSKAAESSRKAAETARHGGSIVNDTLSKMRAIADSVSATAKKVEELGKSSDQIGRIIGVIDDIADQTNLLALNAAIEAARAGEQGRGFAVVADEVRKLAERTTSATKEIAQMIRTVQDETKTAVAAMEEGTKQVEEGVKTTAQAGDSLKEIIQTSEEVGEMITHIATAATEQSSATEEINNNMDQIAKLVKESAEGAQQSAKACQDLSGLALDLQKMVSNFKLDTARRDGRHFASGGRDLHPGRSSRAGDEREKAFSASAG